MLHLTLHITTPTNATHLFEKVVTFIQDNKMGEVMWSTEEENELQLGITLEKDNK